MSDSREQCPTGIICAAWKKLDDGCVARCDQPQKHEGKHLDSVIAISWHTTEVSTHKTVKQAAKEAGVTIAERVHRNYPDTTEVSAPSPSLSAREFAEKWLGERFVTKYEGQLVREVSVQTAIDLAKAYAQSLQPPAAMTRDHIKLRKVMGLSEEYYDTPEKIADAAITRITHLQSEPAPAVQTDNLQECEHQHPRIYCLVCNKRAAQTEKLVEALREIKTMAIMRDSLPEIRLRADNALAAYQQARKEGR